MSQADGTPKIKAHDILRKITLKHLKDAYGEVEIYKSGKMKYWKFNGITVKPYFYADHASTAFIMAPSKANAETVIQENACIMGSDWYGGNQDVIVVYLFRPEIILEHYINGGVETKGGRKEENGQAHKKSHAEVWHVRINHDDANLIFKRAGNAEDVPVPIDDHNYYLQFELTNDEIEELQNAVHKRTPGDSSSKKLLKLIIISDKGEKEFSKKSARTIAILSILKETSELTIEEIYPHLSAYDIAIDKAHPMASVEYILDELLKIEAVVCDSEKKYSINKDVQVEVIL